jgi:hypothetical protein
MAENEKEIMNNSLVIDKIKNASDTSGVNLEADELILTIDKTLDNFTAEAIAAGREYSDYKMNQCSITKLINSLDL